MRRTASRWSAFAVLGLLAAAFGPLPPASAQVATVKAATKVVDELLGWLSKGRGIRVSPERADDLIDALRSVARQGDDIVPEVAALIRRDIASLPVGVCDTTLLKFLSSNPAARDGAWSLALKAAVRDAGPRLERLTAGLGDSAGSIMGKLATTLDGREAALLMRGLGGRMLSREQVLDVVSGFRRLEVSPGIQGELFESVARAQLSRGALKNMSGLKDGGVVIVGKYNQIHGLDGIGAATDGKPVIFEFSMYESKVLQADANGMVQLSPGWVADRWSKLVTGATPEQLSDLRRVGIDRAWIRPITGEEAAKWSRKLVVAHESALTDLNRRNAQLGGDDLLLLGGN